MAGDFMTQTTPLVQDKVVLVTGAGGGIGRDIALAMAREGARVVVNDIGASVSGEGHDDGPAQQVVKEIQALGGLAVASTDSVADAPSAARMVHSAIEAFGRIDVVVNNAGWTHKNGPLLDVDEATFDKVYAINVKSIFHMVHAVVPLMRQQKSGVILNVGSTAGIRPRPGLSWYNGSKGAVNLLSKAMAVELAPDRIRVNALCPVMGATGLLGDFMGVPDTPENRAKFVATIPLGRFCEPRDMAAAAVFLGTDAAEFLTGLEFPVGTRG